MSMDQNESETAPKLGKGGPNESEAAAPKRGKGEHSRSKRPRSAITSGRQLFISGNPNSAWSRRFHDLIFGHIHDVSAGRGPDALSHAQLKLIRVAAAIECELERLDAMLSRSEEVDMDAYARVSGHLRRMWETLGLERRAKTIPGLHDEGGLLEQLQQSNDDA